LRPTQNSYPDKSMKASTSGMRFRADLVVLVAVVVVGLMVFLAVSQVPVQPTVTTVTTTAYVLSTKTVTTTVSQRTMAPDFTLQLITSEGLTNEIFTFSSLRGRPVFMDFVFEWCPHCNNMAPVVERLYREFGDRVAFVTVMGSYGTNPVKSADFLRRHNVSWTAVYDHDMTVFADYAVRGTPTYFIIASDGSVVMMLEGERGYDVLRKALVELVNIHGG